MEERGPSLEERVGSGGEKQKPKGTDNPKPQKGSQGAGGTGVKGPAGKKQGQRGGHPGPVKGQLPLKVSLQVLNFHFEERLSPA